MLITNWAIHCSTAHAEFLKSPFNSSTTYTQKIRYGRSTKTLFNKKFQLFFWNIKLWSARHACKYSFRRLRICTLTCNYWILDLTKEVYYPRINSFNTRIPHNQCEILYNPSYLRHGYTFQNVFAYQQHNFAHSLSTKSVRAAMSKIGWLLLATTQVPLGSSEKHNRNWDIVYLCSVSPISVSFCWDALNSVLLTLFLFWFLKSYSVYLKNRIEIETSSICVFFRRFLLRFVRML